jgi:hypothetical protein
VGSSARKSPAAVLGLALVVALLVAVPVALATEGEITRTEYVAKVEPICKTNTEANSRILKGVKDQVKQGKTGPAGRRFIRASSALGKSVGQIAQVPQPEADKAKLTKWISYLKKEKGFLFSIGKALKSDEKGKAQKLAAELNDNNTDANNTVINFGFKECRIDSSRFI